LGRSRKDPYSPPPPPTEEISAVRRGREKKLFLIIVNVLGHLKGVGELTSYFLCGGGMDVFWNDLFLQSAIDVYVLKVQFLTSEMTTYIASFQKTSLPPPQRK
jgi:hypothetical protein